MGAKKGEERLTPYDTFMGVAPYIWEQTLWAPFLDEQLQKSLITTGQKF